MVSFGKLMKSLFGSKAERDMKAIKPMLAEILAEYPRIDALTDDQLREESSKLKQIIRDRIKEKEDLKHELRSQLEDLNVATEKKVEIASQVDRLTKEVDAQLEEVLLEILPTAFAIVKSTARRFKESEQITVTATEFDRNLSTSKDFVSISGDSAIWKNSWLAGGNLVTWDMVHYDVQLIGGIILHKGNIAEMATGEGKTLVATLPVFLNALAGKGVHVVTTNDYLSRRDSEWMGPLYMFHGLSVDCIDKHRPNSEERKRAYRSDITFGTNNEFGFDYLRDNMAIDPSDLVQKKHHFAIVDEVDSVLIDDARTPLIISGATPMGDIQEFNQYKPYVEKIYNAQKQLISKCLLDAKKLIAEGKTEEGGVLLLRTHKGLPKYGPLIKYLSEPGIKQLLLKTEGIYMQANNKEMPKITDELYFVIEEQQRSIDLTDKGHDLISSNTGDNKFFVLPDLGSEIADLEKQDLESQAKKEQKDIILQNYAEKADRVHTVNQLMKAYAMFEKDVEYIVVDNKIKIVDEQTGRVLDGRRYSDGLHQAIEAKENVKVGEATQTFATITLQNYFRMYHKLSGMTGTAETEAGEFWSIYKLDVVVIPTNRAILRDDQHDFIYKSKKEKYDAVIKKITELTEEGRPVLVGTTSVEVSELLSRMLKLRGIKHNVLNAKQHEREAEVVAEAGRSKAVTIATNMAGRGTDIKLVESVRDAGGLAIIGTERHDSRRVDRQLRGRAGRQGDPGSSIFFVSLEDDLMRQFGSDRIAKFLSNAISEGEVLTSPMLSSSIERAQKKVEENNFGVRKRLLEYDDVMNSQREVIYSKRRNALYGERIDIDILNLMTDVAEHFATESKDLSYIEFTEEIARLLSIEVNFDEKFYEDASPSQISEKLFEQMMEEYKLRSEHLHSTIWPRIKSLYEQYGDKFTNVNIPITTDGVKEMPVVINLKKIYDSEGWELTRAFAKAINLRIIDDFWKEHLREMDDLRQSVQNATYEQKDPLLVYKFESFNLFQKMLETINKEIASYLLRARVAIQQKQEELTEVTRKKPDMNSYQTRRDDLVAGGGGSSAKSNGPVRAEKRAGRNDPCPCGSGKKYKNCHGKEE